MTRRGRRRGVLDLATTITTVDDDGAAAHLTFDIDGNFLMDSSTGTTYWYLNGNTADYASFVIGADGDFTFTTVDAAAAVSLSQSY